jgi:nicotinamidase-related amidase
MGSSKNVVIVCNPQWAYLNSKGSSYLGTSVPSYKESLYSWLSELDKDYTQIYYTKDVRSVDDEFFRSQKTMCEVGSDDVRTMEKFKDFPDMTINTSRPDATYKTPLIAMMSKYSVHKVIVVGVETHCAVLFTAQGLRASGFDVSVIEPLCLSSDEYLHTASISIMADSLGVDILGE